MEKILYLAHTESDGTLSKVAQEALGAAVELSKQLSGSTLTAGLIGGDIEKAASGIGGCGASKVYGVAGAEFKDSRYGSDAAAAEAIVRKSEATIVIAPAGEEAMFRGFLFRGWVRSPRWVWPAIVVISILWAMLHIQYDWAGVLQIFIVGLFLGWMRWRSGSLVLTFLLHGLFNLEGTLETLALLHFAK